MTARNIIIYTVIIIALMVQWIYIWKAGFSITANANGKSLVYRQCIQSGKGGKKPGSTRDCLNSQPIECTKEYPCTPCEVDNKCVPCSSTNTGSCSFLPDVGPYCLYGTEIKPCKKCCS